MRLPEFILGMATGLIFLKGKSAARIATPLILGGLIAGALAAVFSSQIPFAVLHTALLAPAFAALVYGLALLPAWSKFLRWAPLVLLGNASYSLYLLHSNIMGMYFFGNAGLLQHTSPAGIAVGFAIILAAAILVFKFIEEPARKKLRGKTELRKPEAPAELAGSSTVAAV
jgi:peptidoglycan/LPS O-acetylase OafA/YrhL